MVCISECDKELKIDLHPIISKILYLPSAIALLFLYPPTRGNFFPGFVLLFSIFLEPHPLIIGSSLLLALSALFSALFYALDIISMSDEKKRKYIASILSITALIPPALSFVPSMLLGHFSLFSSKEKEIYSLFLPSLLFFLQFAESKRLLLYIALALFALYISSSFSALKLFLDMFEKIGPAQVVGAALTSLAVWFLFFSNPFFLPVLGIIPCSAVVYAPLCKMREPMSTIKRTLICCQLLSFAFVWFRLAMGLR